MNLLRSRLRTGRDRGATMVEYALLIAVFCLGVSAAISYLQDRAEAQFVETAADIGAVGPDIVDTDPDGGDGGGGTPTTSEVPPTSSVPTTTEPAPPGTSSAAFSGVIFDVSGRDWETSAAITVVDATGAPVPYATVTVDIVVRLNDGTSTTTTVQRTTDVNGRITIQDRGRAPSSTRATQVTYSFVDVTADGFDWDGNGSSTTAP